MSTVELPEMIDRLAAKRLAEALLQLRGVDLTLEASAFKRMGAQGAEVILTAQKQWQEDGFTLSFRGLSEAGQAAFTRLGLAAPATAEN